MEGKLNFVEGLLIVVFEFCNWFVGDLFRLVFIVVFGGLVIKFSFFLFLLMGFDFGMFNLGLDVFVEMLRFGWLILKLGFEILLLGLWLLICGLDKFVFSWLILKFGCVVFIFSCEVLFFGIEIFEWIVLGCIDLLILDLLKLSVVCFFVVLYGLFFLIFLM